MAADERRSASRYSTIAVMCKHRRAGEVGLMINSKEMVFRHSPCFYSNPEDRAGLVSTGAWATFQSAPHAFLSPILRQSRETYLNLVQKIKSVLLILLNNVCVWTLLYFP